MKLQAIIRGHLVRRQAVTTLMRLQSVVNIHSQACAKRGQVADCSFHNNYLENRGKDIKVSWFQFEHAKSFFAYYVIFNKFGC